MPFIDTPLTDAIRRTVATTWGVHGSAERLHGGEESAAYRVGDRVVRIGPAWRSTVEAEWCHTIARHAAAAVPEAVAPLPTPEGTTVVRVDGRPVSVWPYVPGGWGAAARWAQAARLLARLHRALAEVRMPPRPRARVPGPGRRVEPRRPGAGSLARDVRRDPSPAPSAARRLPRGEHARP